MGLSRISTGGTVMVIVWPCWPGAWEGAVPSVGVAAAVGVGVAVAGAADGAGVAEGVGVVESPMSAAMAAAFSTGERPFKAEVQVGHGVRAMVRPRHARTECEMQSMLDLLIEPGAMHESAARSRGHVMAMRSCI